MTCTPCWFPMLLVAPKGHWQEQVVHVPKVVQQERQHHFHVEDGADFCCDCWGFFSDVFFSRKRNTQKWRNPWEYLNMNEYVLMFLPRKCKWSVTCLRCPGCTPLFFQQGDPSTSHDLFGSWKVLRDQHEKWERNPSPKGLVSLVSLSRLEDHKSCYTH